LDCLDSKFLDLSHTEENLITFTVASLDPLFKEV